MYNYQSRVNGWMAACFGSKISLDRIERNYRFLEESLELFQSCDGTKEDAYKLVNYVFDRPIGERHQEIGGVMVTLAALCNAWGLDAIHCGEVELKRCWDKITKIREKHKNKPIKSPLPE